MTVEPLWKTCADQWAKDLRRSQEEFRAQLDRENDRAQMKGCFDRMIDRDNFFLRLLMTDFQERLGQ